MNNNWKNIFPKENRYFETDNGILYCGDCMSLMQTFPSSVFDLIIADPPFGIDFINKETLYNRNYKKVQKGYNEIQDLDYYSFSNKWISLTYTLLQQSGSEYIVSGWNHLKEVLESIDDINFIVKNHIIWKYQFGVFTKRKYVTSHYHILFLVKHAKKYLFNKIEHYPEDVWNIKREYWKNKIKTPTKLPVQLVEKIMKFSSNEEQLVLDPFMGSGTTAIVAEQLNRKWVGIEINEQYCEIIKQRIKGDL